MNSYPTWLDSLSLPCVDDDVRIEFEITIDSPPSPPHPLTILVQPVIPGQRMDSRGEAIGALLKVTSAKTAQFMEAALSPELSVTDGLRVELKGLLENHRSALEYVAHYLAERSSPRPAERKVAFPIAAATENQTEFAARFDKLFPGLRSSHPAAREEVLKVQPFSGDDWLSRLGELTNFNKHRSLSELERSDFSYITIGSDQAQLRIGELGFRSLRLSSNGSLRFPTDSGAHVELRAPLSCDASTLSIPTNSPDVKLLRSNIRLYRVSGAAHSLAHEMWAISKNVLRTVTNVCRSL